VADDPHPADAPLNNESTLDYIGERVLGLPRS